MQSLPPTFPRPSQPARPSGFQSPPRIPLPVGLRVWPEQCFQADKVLVYPEGDNPVCCPIPLVQFLHFHASPSPHAPLPLSQRMEEIATLRESLIRLWSEEGPWALTLGSRKVLMSLVRQQFFIKDVAPGEEVPVNRWGVYQAVR